MHLAQKLNHIRSTKNTNLVLSADTTTTKSLLHLCELVGDTICIVKTHMDILEDFSEETIRGLKKLSQEKNFLLLEDRKFADIGFIAAKQYAGGMHKIVEWADMITVHGLPGEGMLEALKGIGVPKNRGCLMVAEMSCSGNLFTSEYTQKILQCAEAHKDFVLGFVSQQRFQTPSDFLYFSPGVSLEPSTDSFGQIFQTPEEKLHYSKPDFLIVGRAIYAAASPREAAQKLQRLSFA